MTSRPLQLALEASFEQLSAAAPANVGIAIARRDRTFSLGRWTTGVAWSTIKVPLAIAALRADSARAGTTWSSKPSPNPITRHRNSYGPSLATRRTPRGRSSCHRGSGDAATVVELRRLRRGFTAFGQTQWTLERQAHFAAQLSLIPCATPVIDLMRHLTIGHQWGLPRKVLPPRPVGAGMRW